MNIDYVLPENFPINEAEEAIGYNFSDKALLIKAFTLPSFSNEHPDYTDNDCLEFLGDSALSLIVSEYLYASGGTAGQFTDKKKKIVSSVPLSYVSEKHQFYRFLVMGKGDHKNFSLKNRKILENLFEALVGAIYLDGGYSSAKKFVTDKLLIDDEAQNLFNDYISELKEFLEKRKITNVRYISESISQQKSVFKTKLFINDELITEAECEGAEINSRQLASKIALTIIKKGEI